ncbi:ABC transporter ATP-binding protein [Agrobacterium sp. ICMP 6402]|uniref:ABC transporter ATP-binding protein n=1 Tax=Agrobacterium sp. ICMP 6402 TaxID=2292443 RepID=UPI001FEE45E6|nr:ABC transporter ATP-binding protein [Agrobacterium sp. ICMP 6402]
MAGKNVTISNVSKFYGSVTAVDSVEFDVREGEFVSLLGPSGCGKTTTLRMIAGLETISDGDIRIGGKRVNDVPVHRRNIGMVFQNHALFPHKTAFDNIAYGLQLRKLSKTMIEERVRRALDVVRLPHIYDRLPAQLSGGQQQRVAVARAIVIEPDLLLFDEPLSALDANLREEMRVELKRIQRDLGITTIFVTHDQAEALAMSDKVVVMNHGRKEQEGPPEEIFNRPRSEFVAKFFGQFSRVRAEIKDNGETCSSALLGGQFPARLAVRLPIGKTQELLLRSERVLVDTDHPEISDADIFEGVVLASEYLGMLVRYTVAALGTEVGAIQPHHGRSLPVGSRVKLRVAHDAWLVLQED